MADHMSSEHLIGCVGMRTAGGTQGGRAVGRPAAKGWGRPAAPAAFEVGLWVRKGLDPVVLCGACERPLPSFGSHDHKLDG